jgi:nitrile hydratase
MSTADGEHEAHPGAAPDENLSHRAKRALAIQELLTERGIISREDVEEGIGLMRKRSPADGAAVVARAWVDPAFKERLLADARGAVAELGYTLTHDAELEVVANTQAVHHLVVCTLCSCYPGSLLGSPPDWYKSLAYRQRAVIEPRSVMREFGLELGDDVQVKVVDSTADLRYLVLPLRPMGTDGMIEAELAELVTRDSMVGVTEPRSPSAARAG